LAGLSRAGGQQEAIFDLTELLLAGDKTRQGHNIQQWRNSSLLLIKLYGMNITHNIQQWRNSSAQPK
jgi:hypothetical protein